MNELKACPFCGNHVEMVNTKTYPNFERSPAYMKCKTCNYHIAAFDDENLINRWNTRPIEDELRAELAALKSENVNLSKKVTDYEKELRQSYKYDKTCSTCRYLDENRNCVLGIRCVNYTLWQGKIL